ncbi:Uncharacterised protein [Alistipes sp. cv1]|nr:Uncharacterised protein [Faecalibacterium prausnitzii]
MPSMATCTMVPVSLTAGAFRPSLREMGCLDQLSASAAASTSCSSLVPSAGWMPVTLKVPWVRVPVLSNTTMPVRASSSR